MNRRFVTSLILVAMGLVSASAFARPPHKAHPGRPPAHAQNPKQVGPSAEPKPLPILGFRRVDGPDTARPEPSPQPEKPGGKLKRPPRHNQLKPRPAL